MTEPLFPLAGRRVWVAGHGGMVGSALLRRLARSDAEVITVGRDKLDLRDPAATLDWVRNNRPEMIFIAAARVGGIDANARYPADFIHDNLAINLSIVGAAARAEVAKVMVLGSSCIYPKLSPQPMAEAALLTGPLEPTNLWYALAKISSLKLAEAYRLQHGCDFISAMPTSLYGTHDRYDESRSHVIPALMMKVRRALAEKAEEIEVWGSGTPLREFLHVDDCADALVFLAEHYSDAETINVGSGFEISIRDLAERICRIAGFEGRLRLDTSRPDGPPRKRVDNSRIEALGWRPKIDFDDGLRETYAWLLGSHPAEAPRGN